MGGRKRINGDFTRQLEMEFRSVMDLQGRWKVLDRTNKCFHKSVLTGDKMCLSSILISIC